MDVARSAPLLRYLSRESIAITSAALPYLSILAALERNEWHITRTAKELGLADHASLLKIMRRHGISSR